MEREIRSNCLIMFFIIEDNKTTGSGHLSTQESSEIQGSYITAQPKYTTILQ